MGARIPDISSVIRAQWLAQQQAQNAANAMPMQPNTGPKIIDGECVEVVPKAK